MNQLAFPVHPGPLGGQHLAGNFSFPSHGASPQTQGSSRPALSALYPSHGSQAYNNGRAGMQQQSIQSAAYTSAPISRSASASAPAVQQQSNLRHSASPQQRHSPYAAFESQQQPKQPTPPLKYPMAAPPLPQTPSATASYSPRTPQSPDAQALERRRIDLLLDINLDLLQEIHNLQAQGKGGATSPQHQAQLRAAGLSDKMATEEYVQCLRRAQANLAYMASRADAQVIQKPPLGPAHMTPPTHMPQLQVKYDQLKELFPDWIGHDQRSAYSTGSPGMGSMNLMNGITQMQASARV